MTEANEVNEINVILIKKKIKKEHWDWVRRYSLKTNRAYIKSMLDILIDIQFKNFYSPGKVNVTPNGYNRDVQLAQISHLVDCRVIKEQETHLYQLVKNNLYQNKIHHKILYVAGPEFKRVFKSKTKLTNKQIAKAYKKITDDYDVKFKVEIDHPSISQITNINSFNLRHKFEIDGCVFDPSVYRVFGDDEGKNGRFHSQYQQLSEEKRERIMIDGEKTIERDYSQMHLSLIYRANGFIEPPDMYTQIYPKDRAVGKKIILYTMNADSTFEARKAVRYHLKLSEYEINKIFIKLKKFPFLHPEEGRGLKIMRLESEISLKIMSDLISLRVPVLNVHDSFIVPLKHQNELDSLMKQYLKPEVVIDISSKWNLIRVN